MVSFARSLQSALLVGSSKKKARKMETVTIPGRHRNICESTKVSRISHISKGTPRLAGYQEVSKRRDQAIQGRRSFYTTTARKHGRNTIIRVHTANAQHRLFNLIATPNHALDSTLAPVLRYTRRKTSPRRRGKVA